MNLKYKHTAKTKEEWEELNPIVVDREIVIEKDTNRLKIGNGVDNYSELKYVISDHFENAIDYNSTILADSTDTLVIGKVERIILQLLNSDGTIIYDHKELFMDLETQYVYLNRIDIELGTTKVVSIAVKISKNEEGVYSISIDEKLYNTTGVFDFSTLKLRVINK